MKTFISILEWWQQALFPYKCLVCRQESFVLCPKHQSLPTVIIPPLETFKPLDGFYALTDYHHPSAKGLVRYLKFHRHQAPAALMAEYLAQIAPWERWPHATVMPLPLHWWRQHQRGFNQSHLVAHSLATFLNLDYQSNGLKRCKLTKQQARLTKSERLKNMQNAFVWEGAGPPPPIVILFDDVCTTGTTLKEAAKTLKKAGSKIVIGVVFAYQSLD